VCAEEVVEQVYEYESNNGPGQHFHRPRGLDVQPFVTFETPRHGDYVNRGQAVDLRWRDSRVERINFAFSTLDPVQLKGEGAPIILTQDEREDKNFKRDLYTLYTDTTNAFMVPGERYRIEARVCMGGQDCIRVPVGSREESLSSTGIEIRFDEPTAEGGTCSDIAINASPSPLRVFFGTELRFSYRIDLPPGDSLSSTVIVDVDVPPEDITKPDLAVQITQAANQQALSGRPRVKIKTEKDQSERFAMHDFVLNVSFSTTQCGQQVKAIPVQVVPNIGAVDEIIKEEFDERKVLPSANTRARSLERCSCPRGPHPVEGQ
jgi:hypothetical protein